MFEMWDQHDQQTYCKKSEICTVTKNIKESNCEMLHDLNIVPHLAYKL